MLRYRRTLKRTKVKNANWAAAVLHQEQGISADTVRSLQRFDGVELVAPNWMTSMLTITYDPTLIHLEDLKKIIEEGKNRGERTKKPYYRGLLC
jgi:hypothetical protein